MLLLLYSAACVVYGFWYKHTSKAIAPLVLLQGLSHYNSICIMHVLIGYVEASQFTEAREKVMKVFWILHACFVPILVWAMHKAECDQDNFYPDSFIFTNSFFFGVYLMLYKLSQ